MVLRTYYPIRSLVPVSSEAADASARSAALLKALLCAGLYPNVLVAPRDVRLGEKAPEVSVRGRVLSFRVSRREGRRLRFAPHNAIDATYHWFLAGGAVLHASSKSKTAGECAFTRCDPDVERCIKERQESGRRPRFDDGPEDAAYLHPCCLCFDATALDHRYVVYREIVRTAKVLCPRRDDGGAACLILFGGRLTVHHERGIISVDEKVHFRAPPKVATLASILRSELEALLLRKIVTPDAQVDQRERAFVDASRRGPRRRGSRGRPEAEHEQGRGLPAQVAARRRSKEKPVVVSI